jgi:hypothetical protein
MSRLSFWDEKGNSRIDREHVEIECLGNDRTRVGAMAVAGGGGRRPAPGNWCHRGVVVQSRERTPSRLAQSLGCRARGSPTRRYCAANPWPPELKTDDEIARGPIPRRGDRGWIGLRPPSRRARMGRPALDSKKPRIHAVTRSIWRDAPWDDIRRRLTVRLGARGISWTSRVS